LFTQFYDLHNLHEKHTAIALTHSAKTRRCLSSVPVKFLTSDGVMHYHMNSANVRKEHTQATAIRKTL